ncbi:hypothetical protein [Burkholderia ambifaria]|uniref:hypothetical protein n=1 Tax=Burkholderia ambifaria TaxID=152480 RepID=UPI001D12C874|nr:hypothetical protein [Burkholderia ambifaria]
MNVSRDVRDVRRNAGFARVRAENAHHQAVQHRKPLVVRHAGFDFPRAFVRVGKRRHRRGQGGLKHRIRKFDTGITVDRRHENSFH